ncbi:50S ribosomal protein L25 [Candidatus Uhrbacteria bacterium]|nr:50S ribosomal protein L25 [Candidatus Uhrbacteria bacterium]
MESPILNAEPRTALGHQAARLRRAGKIPAVVYGHGVASRPITIGAAEFLRAYRVAGESTLLDLAVAGGSPVKTLIQDVAHDPLTGAFIHVDFREVSMTEKITTRIPLRFIGEAPAVATGTAVLVKHMDHIEVEALPSALVHEIAVDCSGLATLDASIHLRDLVPPPGITFRQDPSEAVVSVTEVKVEEEAPAAVASVAEVEVVGKKDGAAPEVAAAPVKEEKKSKK